MQQSAYQVELPVFQGPLDLLLHLIEHQELDITAVSLSQVTNQFLEYVGQLGERDPDSLADFLVIAAKLLLIKSRALLPHPPLAATPEEDVARDLVEQLKEYRKFKEAAGWLRDKETQGLQSYVRLAAAPHLEHNLDLGGITLQELLLAARQALEVQPAEPSVNGALPPLTVSIADRIAVIAREISQSRSVSFLSLVKQATSRLEVVVTLLAVLEMVKQRTVRMHQVAPFGDIWISAREPEASEPWASLPGT